MSRTEIVIMVLALVVGFFIGYIFGHEILSAFRG
jgi:hypothetical protein